jgi:hypothetical protein
MRRRRSAGCSGAIPVATHKRGANAVAQISATVSRRRVGARSPMKIRCRLLTSLLFADIAKTSDRKAISPWGRRNRRISGLLRQKPPNTRHLRPQRQNHPITRCCPQIMSRLRPRRRRSRWRNAGLSSAHRDSFRHTRKRWRWLKTSQQLFGYPRLRGRGRARSPSARSPL